MENNCVASWGVSIHFLNQTCVIIGMIIISVKIMRHVGPSPCCRVTPDLHDTTVLHTAHCTLHTAHCSAWNKAAMHQHQHQQQQWKYLELQKKCRICWSAQTNKFQREIRKTFPSIPQTLHRESSLCINKEKSSLSISLLLLDFNFHWLKTRDVS